MRSACTRAVALAAACTMLSLPTAAQARFGDATLRVGSSGHEVRVLQSWLGHLGFRTSVDGQFGRGTQSTLRRFEGHNRLSVNGVLSRWDARRMRAMMEKKFGGTSRRGGAGIVPGSRARLSADGRTAVAPADAPQEVRDAIAAANRITSKPYKYGGGHGRWEDSGYDCSGTVSYALHGAGLLRTALDSSAFMSWGSAGAGRWITVYAHGGHAYAVIAGLRLDTSGRGEKGPRWRAERGSTRGYRVRHPAGL
jgi:peptidoglycan hydrolase-like protein with peptidoglycan-binding domain